MALAAFPPKAQTELRRGVVRTWETGEEVSIASSLTRLDGARRDVLVRFKAEPPPGRGPPAAIAGIMLDVTEARAFDERLQREKDLLQATLDHMDQGLIVVEPRPERPGAQPARDRDPEPARRSSPRPRRASARSCDYQYESGAISRETMTSSINSFILNREELPETHVYERETFDGKVLEVRTSRLPGGGFVRTFTDATARKRREAEIAHAQAEYRTLFENAAIGIYRVSVDGRQVRANPALARLNGYDSEAELVAAVERRRPALVRRARPASQEYRGCMRDGRAASPTSSPRSTATAPASASGSPRPPGRSATRDGDDRRLRGHGGRGDRAQARRGAHRPHGAPRRADRPAEPAALQRAARGGARRRAGRWRVLCLDLDRFKIVNDTLGPSGGRRAAAGAGGAPRRAAGPRRRPSRGSAATSSPC